MTPSSDDTKHTISVRRGDNHTTAEKPVSAPQHEQKTKQLRSKRTPWILVAAVLVILAGAIATFVFLPKNDGFIDSSRYQAVFFTNGQVYFGKLDNTSSDYMRLTDVYYLQTKSDEKGNNPQQASNASDVELIKLGGEIHGPEDEMVVSKDQVLFFENLKTDSTVARTIAEDKEKQNN